MNYQNSRSKCWKALTDCIAIRLTDGAYVISADDYCRIGEMFVKQKETDRVKTSKCCNTLSITVNEEDFGSDYPICEKCGKLFGGKHLRDVTKTIPTPKKEIEEIL